MEGTGERLSRFSRISGAVFQDKIHRFDSSIENLRTRIAELEKDTGRNRISLENSVSTIIIGGRL